MRRALAALAVAAVVLAVASQFLLPPFLESQVEGRLTEGGGSADVSLAAVPAARLLAGDGSHFRATGQDLRVDLAEPRPEVFERLEGFSEVDIRLANVTAGPFQTRTLRITRAPDAERYSLELSATVSPQDASRFLATQVGGPLGGLVGELAGRAASLPDAPVPVDLRTEVAQVDGRWQTVGGEGTVAGIPAGPFAGTLAAAIVARL